MVLLIIPEKNRKFSIFRFFDFFSHFRCGFYQTRIMEISCNTFVHKLSPMWNGVRIKTLHPELYYIKLHRAKLSEIFFCVSSRRSSSISAHTLWKLGAKTMDFVLEWEWALEIDLDLRGEVQESKSDNFARWSFI